MERSNTALSSNDIVLNSASNIEPRFQLNKSKNMADNDVQRFLQILVSALVLNLGFNATIGLEKRTLTSFPHGKSTRYFSVTDHMACLPCKANGKIRQPHHEKRQEHIGFCGHKTVCALYLIGIMDATQL